jgi:hypothetical protein
MIGGVDEGDADAVSPAHADGGAHGHGRQLLLERDGVLLGIVQEDAAKATELGMHALGEDAVRDVQDAELGARFLVERHLQHCTSGAAAGGCGITPASIHPTSSHAGSQRKSAIGRRRGSSSAGSTAAQRSRAPRHARTSRPSTAI